MNSYEAYTLYLAIKLHFTSDTYDFYRHNAKVNSSFNTFLKRNDRFFFHKLTTKYTREEMLEYFVSNFFHNSKTWIGPTINGESIINHLRTILEMIAYWFVMSLMVIGFGLMMFSALIVGSIQDCYDYCCRNKFQFKVLSYLTKCWVLLNVGIKKLKKLLSGLKPEKSFKLKKLNPFIKFNLTKCKFIMKEVFV